MAKTHAELLAIFKKVVKDPNVKADDFDFYVNDTQPTFLRKLALHGLHRSHIRYIPKLKLTLTSNQWQYDWLDVAKYSIASIGDTAGVITLAGTQSIYFIAPGDLATYNSIDYQIIAAASGTLTIDTSVGGTTNALAVYARPLMFTDAYLLGNGGSVGRDERYVQKAGDMQVPDMKDEDDPYYRVAGDKIEVGWNPSTSDVLHLFYIPEPVKFDNSNSLMTALTNPTQLTDEANRAAMWYAGISYWTQKGDAEKVVACKARVGEILGVAGLSKGQVEW